MSVEANWTFPEDKKISLKPFTIKAADGFIL